MMFRRLVCLMCLLLASTLALADAPRSGVVTGTVRASDDQALAGATVQLEGERGTETAVTGGDGKFTFSLVVPGSYAVRADLHGFQPAIGAIAVTAGGRADVILVLHEVAGEEIVVIADAEMVNRFNATLGGSVTGDVALEFTAPIRTYQGVTNTLPGVTQNSVSEDFGGIRPEVNGNRWEENASFVDRVDTSHPATGGSSRLMIPTSALQEVSLEGTGYGAEYGRVVGGVTTVVTKSGTNTYHGAFDYIAQNQSWDAQSDRVPLPRKDEIISSYEASLGGPIVRDRGWFFVAAGKFTTNQLDAVGDGTVVETSLEGDSRLAKLDFQPADRHRLAARWVETPVTRPVFDVTYWDLYTVPLYDIGGDFAAVSWDWAVTDSAFLELHAARQTSNESRTELALRQIDPGASPDNPAGTTGFYFDAADVTFHNGIALVGIGDVKMPREQANLGLNWFVGGHDIKGGLDLQTTTLESRISQVDGYVGLFYSEAFPGGFAVPLQKRVYHPSDGVVSTQSTNFAAYVRDIVELGEHWVVNLGARVEKQSHENDIGETVAESTNAAPRLAATYDVWKDSRLLVLATAGRYYSQITQNTVTSSFLRTSNGLNAYDLYLFNKSSQRYDIFVTTVLPEQTRIGKLDPYYQDQFTLGLEWQLHPDWVAKARAIYWTMGDLFNSYFQYSNGLGSPIINVVENVSEAEREYKGLQLELNRRFKNNWVVRFNYTWSDIQGNLFGNNLSTNTADDFLEYRDILDPVTDEPATAVNRYGHALYEHEHSANLSGLKRWGLGRHSLSVGGFLEFRSGRPWGLQKSLTVPGGNPTTIFLEPRDAHKTPDTYRLNVTGAWDMPLGAAVTGQLRVEVINLTDVQEVLNVNYFTGEPSPIRRHYQRPRQFRVLVGLSF